MGMPKPKYPRDKHATISVISHKAQDFQSIDEYLKYCEQRYKVEYFKKMSTTEQAWNEVMKSTNAAYHFRGKNIVLECLQFGGNREFWAAFNSEQAIHGYFAVCYRYAIDKVGFLRTHENIIYAVVVTEPNRRNFFVYYLPITEVWQEKIMSNDKSEAGNRLQLRDEYDMPMYRHREEIDEPLLSHSAFWKARGGLVSYSALQEDFFKEVSEKYGAKRDESFSLVKNTVESQRKRYHRTDGDLYDELYYDGY